jgi:hypothetical protein
MNLFTVTDKEYKSRTFAICAAYTQFRLEDCDHRINNIIVSFNELYEFYYEFLAILSANLCLPSQLTKPSALS